MEIVQRHGGFVVRFPDGAETMELPYAVALTIARLS